MRRLFYLFSPLAFLAQPSLTHHPGNTAPPSDHSDHAVPATRADSDLTADQQVMQVLNRLTFGPKPGDVAAVRKIGVRAWIDQQLHPERINDSALDHLLQTAYPLINQDQNELAQNYAGFVRARILARKAKRDTTNQLSDADREAFKRIMRQRIQLVAELSSARVTRAELSNRQLLEVMTDFWENHFNIYVRKGPPEAYYLVDFDRTIRAHALGKFRDLLGAVAHSPAMLYYLDNSQSRANPGEPTLQPQPNRAAFLRRLQQGGGRFRNLDSAQLARLRQAASKQPNGLNENYGRELLELHTLGVDGGYTQHDVIAVARALTGWSIRPPAQGGGFIFRPQWHDDASKVFLGHTLPAGRGEADGEDVLDIIARSPATAHFISLQLARRFVSDSPSTALVDRAAQTFLRTDGDIRQVVRTIVTSPEFFSSAAYRSKVKSPFEVVVSTARALGAQADLTPSSALAIAYMGQPIYGHQDPNGWPETSESWMNTGAILNRINFGMAVAANRLPGASINTLQWVQTLANAPREQQVDTVVAHILGGAVSPDMHKILLSGDHPFAQQAAQAARAATDTASDHTGTSSNANAAIFGRNGFGPPPNLTGIAQVIGLALGSPEFQRR